jgi:hypothetical protein
MAVSCSTGRAPSARLAGVVTPATASAWCITAMRSANRISVALDW